MVRGVPRHVPVLLWLLMCPNQQHGCVDRSECDPKVTTACVTNACEAFLGHVLSVDHREPYRILHMNVFGLCTQRAGSKGARWQCVDHAHDSPEWKAAEGVLLVSLFALRCAGYQIVHVHASSNAAQRAVTGRTLAGGTPAAPRALPSLMQQLPHLSQQCPISCAMHTQYVASTEGVVKKRSADSSVAGMGLLAARQVADGLSAFVAAAAPHLEAAASSTATIFSWLAKYDAKLLQHLGLPGAPEGVAGMSVEAVAEAARLLRFNASSAGGNDAHQAWVDGKYSNKVKDDPRGAGLGADHSGQAQQAADSARRLGQRDTSQDMDYSNLLLECSFKDSIRWMCTGAWKKGSKPTCTCTGVGGGFKLMRGQLVLLCPEHDGESDITAKRCRLVRWPCDADGKKLEEYKHGGVTYKVMSVDAAKSAARRAAKAQQLSSP
ncbi:hypothetical protein JKP88DRAFT_264039 [Tribonema minus]|uniref:Uncharacterized protein n=1 Tax=Tribonema minus TaxID=303371 RepID=A0A836CBZ6_9STRA|nr:hypothetical protein JKP88DRAFT_264039 [Tribonema minus]